MTIELVDGKAGTAHISSEDKAIIHQAKFGASDMVFEWGDAMSCTMQSANKAVIGTGCASIQGLDWHITNPETVTIQSGSSGKNRNDIICAHYHRETSTGVEKVELVAFKGVPSDGAAVDPTIPSAKILNGAADAYMPLWRIPLTGITAGTPVRLFNKRYALWDSVTQCGLYDGKTDANGFLMVPNPFKQSSGVYSFCQLYPNGMDDVEGKRFSAFPWDITKDRLRFRIRRGDTNGWLGETHRVIVQWFAIKQQ